MIKTKVIFRKLKHRGEIIAIFPEELGDNSPYTCSSYMHIGQHGACDPWGMIQSSTPARLIEYLPLAQELIRIGYKLNVIRRNRYAFIETRRKAIAEIK